jgi:hypothetical protein
MQHTCFDQFRNAQQRDECGSLIAGAEAADYTLDLAHAQLADNILLTSDTCDADLTLVNKPVVHSAHTRLSLKTIQNQHTLF